jgi:hypothetical protein
VKIQIFLPIKPPLDQNVLQIPQNSALKKVNQKPAPIHVIWHWKRLEMGTIFSWVYCYNQGYLLTFYSVYYSASRIQKCTHKGRSWSSMWAIFISGVENLRGGYKYDYYLHFFFQIKNIINILLHMRRNWLSQGKNKFTRNWINIERWVKNEAEILCIIINKKS